MAGRSIPAESREIAYSVWRGCGQNVEATVRELKVKHGLMVTKPTILAWRKKYDWQDRAARAEGEERKARETATLSFDERMVNDLVSQKDKYEKYFETQGPNTLDNQATYAYTNIIKTIIELRKKLQVSDVIKKAEKDKKMSKEELIKLIKEDLYGLA